MNKILNYINGTYVAPKSNEWIDNYNPSNGEIYGKIPNSSSEDVEAAYQAAKAAFPSWSSTTLDERSRILSKIADLIQENLADLAERKRTYNCRIKRGGFKTIALVASHHYCMRLFWLQSDGRFFSFGQRYSWLQ